MILKSQNSRYRRLFETAQDAILILDGDTGEIIDANIFILNCWDTRWSILSANISGNSGFIKDKSIAQQAFTELKMNGYIRYEDMPLETKAGKV